MPSSEKKTAPKGAAEVDAWHRARIAEQERIIAHPDHAVKKWILDMLDDVGRDIRDNSRMRRANWWRMLIALAEFAEQFIPGDSPTEQLDRGLEFLYEATWRGPENDWIAGLVCVCEERFGPDAVINVDWESVPEKIVTISELDIRRGLHRQLQFLAERPLSEINSLEQLNTRNRAAKELRKMEEEPLQLAAALRKVHSDNAATKADLSARNRAAAQKTPHGHVDAESGKTTKKELVLRAIRDAGGVDAKSPEIWTHLFGILRNERLNPEEDGAKDGRRISCDDGTVFEFGNFKSMLSNIKKEAGIRTQRGRPRK